MTPPGRGGPPGLGGPAARRGSLSTESARERARTFWAAGYSVVPLILLIVALASTTGSRAVMAGIGVVVVVGLVRGFGRAPHGLQFSTAVVHRTAVGAEFEQQIRLQNTAGRPSGGCVVSIGTPGLTDAQIWCPELAPGEVAVATLRRTGVARGSSDGQLVVATRWAPFGQRTLQVSGLPPTRTIVHPAAAPVLPLLRDDDGEGLPARRGGTDVAGIRRWTPGDSPRAVHWRATARHGTLIVAERAEPTAVAVQVLVVGDRFDDHGEFGLARLAATAVAALRAGHPVRIGWLTRDNELRLAPIQSRTAVLDWFAGIGAGDTAAADTSWTGIAGQSASTRLDGAAVVSPADLARHLGGIDAHVVFGVDVDRRLFESNGFRLFDAATGDAVGSRGGSATRPPTDPADDPRADLGVTVRAAR